MADRPPFQPDPSSVMCCAESDGVRHLSKSPQISGSHPASPVSSNPPQAQAASPTQGLVQLSTASDRAAAELAEFQTRQLDDFDPDGPPAMKDSPSVSGESDNGGYSLNVSRLVGRQAWHMSRVFRKTQEATREIIVTSDMGLKPCAYT